MATTLLSPDEAFAHVVTAHGGIVASKATLGSVGTSKVTTKVTSGTHSMMTRTTRLVQMSIAQRISVLASQIVLDMVGSVFIGDDTTGTSHGRDGHGTTATSSKVSTTATVKVLHAKRGHSTWGHHHFVAAHHAHHGAKGGHATHLTGRRSLKAGHTKISAKATTWHGHGGTGSASHTTFKSKAGDTIIVVLKSHVSVTGTHGFTSAREGLSSHHGTIRHESSGGRSEESEGKEFNSRRVHGFQF
mmetsp:Transcript_76319/g.221549  ORF Transcript_76319/g.221549 Transcript_76319/m.221549 type:complete len:245 (+) Transcript_76319:320-1054(+)